MNVLVTYQSKTGFTKRYAGWIAQELSCEAKELSCVTPADVKSHELVIHGGWIMGGAVSGLEKLRALGPQRLVVFGVGFTPKEQAGLSAYIAQNKLGDTPFFYYEGGMAPQQMGFMGRAVVRMVTKKPLAYADRTDKAAIKELTAMAQRLLSP